jgi:hypothetical protein
MTEIEEWKRKRVTGVVLEYMRGRKPRADLNWCIGCLTKSFGLSLSEINLLIESVEKDPTVIRTTERDERLRLLKEKLKEI